MNIFLKTKKKLKLSYETIGNAIGMDRSFLHRMMNENVAMTKMCLVKLSEYLGIDSEVAIAAWKEMELKRLKETVEIDCEELSAIFRAKQSSLLK